MTNPDRHACPDCGASHKRNKPKIVRQSTAANTDLKPGRCGICNHQIIRGRIDTLERALDPRALNEIGWLTVRATGRTTFTIRGLRATPHNHATRWPPPTGTAYRTLHDCHRPIGDELGAPVIRHPKPTTTPTDPPY